MTRIRIRGLPDIKQRRHLDSHRSTVTTQTQNKTRQNYYLIVLQCQGDIRTNCCGYSHRHKALRTIIIVNKYFCFLFTKVNKKVALPKDRATFQFNFVQFTGYCLEASREALRNSFIIFSISSDALRARVPAALLFFSI
nr:MAG TPA: hypothetical protein [Caudoviricetes sp.]